MSKKDPKKEVSMEEWLDNLSKAMNKETTDGRGDDEEETEKKEES